MTGDDSALLVLGALLLFIGLVLHLPDDVLMPDDDDQRP